MIGTPYIGLYDDSGSKNAFYIIKDKKIDRKKIGFKEFENKIEAQFAYKIQSILANINLAPRIYGQMGRISKGDDELTNYGYLTEIARTMPQCNDYDCDGDCTYSECKNSQIIQTVLDRLENAGLIYSDNHRGNFGFVRRNSKWIPVVIDVGIESFDEWDESIYGSYKFNNEYGSSSVECDCTACQLSHIER